MASRKTSKTSKTDHVLNLLAGTRPAAEPPKTPPQEAEASAAAAAPEPAPVSRLTPPILEVARTNHEALSNTIHDALEAALEEELANAVPAAQAPETPPPSPADAPPPVREPEGTAAPPEELQEPDIPPPEPAAPAEPEAELPPPAPPKPALSEPDAAPKPAEPAADPAPPEAEEPRLRDAQFLNVMELLVEEKLSRYVRMFHLCHCPRCLADAKALALSRLPAKYVVLPAASVAPMLGMYRSRYDGDVTTQIIYACKAVMDAPRHSEPVQDN